MLPAICHGAVSCGSFSILTARSGRGDVLKDRDKRGKMLGARSYMKRFEESDETPSFTFQSQALGICFHATVLTRSQEEINEKGYSPVRRCAARRPGSVRFLVQ